MTSTYRKKRDYYVTCSRVVPYKKIHLIVEAFRKMPNRKLVVERHGCGIVIDPGDSADLARQISRLKDNPDICATMGRRARELLDCEFTRHRAINRWTELLRSL